MCRRIHFFAASFFLCLAVRAAADCSLTSLGIAPLCDLTGLYASHEGGLYPGGTSARPASHEVAGLAIANGEILPRNISGEVDLINGRIVLISIGMSNATQEFRRFVQFANADGGVNPQLTIVDGAQGGQPATAWLEIEDGPWQVLDQRLVAAGVSSEQVQVLWLKQAERFPGMLGVFPEHADILRQHLEFIVRIAKFRFPNLRLAYVSNRSRAYRTEINALSPEPYAFESGFATRWLIEQQLNGDPDLNFDPASGEVTAPWLSWGPYLWADGIVPRSDGFTWQCSDTQDDFTHPSASGEIKVGKHLLAFFKTDVTARPWFLRSEVVGQPPSCEAQADLRSGAAPLTVSFDENASDADGTVEETLWTFGDGTFSLTTNPTKIFHLPGRYTASVTVTDDVGNAVSRDLVITVHASGEAIAHGVLFQ